MNHKAPPSRIVPRYTEMIEVPKDIQPFLWDHPTGKAPLEKLILRTFRYGDFGQLKRIYEHYPEACRDIVSWYPNIKRGVKYWIKDWYGSND